jgi:hypothetical protein
MELAPGHVRTSDYGGGQKSSGLALAGAGGGGPLVSPGLLAHHDVATTMTTSTARPAGISTRAILAGASVVGRQRIKTRAPDCPFQSGRNPHSAPNAARVRSCCGSAYAGFGVRLMS